MDYEKHIIKTIGELQGKFTPYQIFSDWIAMASISIQNMCYPDGEIRTKREEQYKNIAAKYNSDELTKIAHMTGALTLALEDKFSDVLGSVYMKAGCGSSATGQFFTPYHLSYVTAKLAYTDRFKDLQQGEVITLNEPSTGGGGMMIAALEVAKEYGINYQKQVRIIAQDLDWNGVYMTYLQLSLLGADAVVVQGDTLSKYKPCTYLEYHLRRFKTPVRMGALM